MNIQFSESLKDCLENMRLGIVEFAVDVKESSTDFLKLIDSESNKIRDYLSSEGITKNAIIADTRIAYKKCGKDPSRYRPSADSLMRRIVKGNNLYYVNNIVDILNLISIKSGFSIGGYDVSKISGKVVFDIGLADDVYYGIGRGLLNIQGLPVLRDSIGVFGSPTSDSERTMITEKASRIAYIYYDFGFSNILEETIHLTEKYLRLYSNAEGFSWSVKKL